MRESVRMDTRTEIKRSRDQEREESWCKHEDKRVRDNQNFRKRTRNLIVGDVTEESELTTEKRKER